ncbi:hypothetical protein T4E_7966 [Trichinella pseudospiralis]|uniref:Uncharacterized protein n=1 Tax=Trichinella pseudospiralis TaxID=6337 RepID=A0A0V0YCX7_TRIPS|nr:hypothetical protein T4E_7966 [Trichinella pseudospiralis]KRY87199.1 hypothetical protein T4D_9929 [Trichinella pseudospiralis]
MRLVAFDQLSRKLKGGGNSPYVRQPPSKLSCRKCWQAAMINNGSIMEGEAVG